MQPLLVERKRRLPAPKVRNLPLAILALATAEVHVPKPMRDTVVGAHRRNDPSILAHAVRHLLAERLAAGLHLDGAQRLSHGSEALWTHATALVRWWCARHVEVLLRPARVVHHVLVH
eukprot:6186222-Pleurochrysis_carterae.AAC.1